MITPVSGIYDEPELYQLACSYRDVKAEAGVLLALTSRHARGGAAGSVLELAAGPAEHARELARRGLRATALDLSPAMSRFSAEQAAAAGLDLHVVTADMRDFRISGEDGATAKFDLVITMLNSLCHLYTLDDLLPHLGAVAGHVRPGGLYIVELAHPADYFGREPRTSSEWTLDAGGTHADVRWGGRSDRIDPVTQVTDEHMTITATSPEGLVRTVSDVVPNRFWTYTEFTAAVRLAAVLGGEGSGFTLAATYGDFDETTPLDAPTAWRMIIVLQAAGAP